MNRTGLAGIAIIAVAAVISVAVIPCPAGAEIDEATKKAVTQAAMDYMDGAHAGDAARMERAIHPEITKVTVMRMPTGRDILRKTGSTRLIEVIRANAAPLPEDERNIGLDIFVVREGLAAVKITSAMFYDYLLLADVGGEWKIINVLWKSQTAWLEKTRPQALEGKEPADETADRKGIEAAALDYLEGYFTGDGERLARGVHPELTKVWPRTMQQTGRPWLEKIGAGFLIEAAAMGSGKMEPDQRKIDITILDYAEDIALVEALSAVFYDYLQVAKIDGEWRIINVLWTLNPDRPKR
jgi:hypothetical protein